MRQALEDLAQISRIGEMLEKLCDYSNIGLLIFIKIERIKMTQIRDEIIEKIAKKTLGIKTLKTRKRDRFDFYDNEDGSIAVWSLKEALQKAYETGRNNSKLDDFATNDKLLAIVDLADNSIVHVDGYKHQAEDIIKDVIIPAEEDKWLEEHPGYKDLDAPDYVRKSLEKRFVVIRCVVSVKKP